MSDSLYARLGGYDAIVAVVNELLPRLQGDAQLARFWQHRGTDGVQREKQLLINYLCACAGGPMVYVGRDMKTCHRGMGISDTDWRAFMGHVEATLNKFGVSSRERSDVVAFIDGLRMEIVD